MAVALRDLDHGGPPRRASLRVVAPRPRPPTPRRVYRLRRLVVVLITGLLVVGGVLGARALGDDRPPVTARFEMAVVMPAGGTLWDLADLYAPDGDRAAWIAAVADRNHVDPRTIAPGTPLTVPVETRRVSAGAAAGYGERPPGAERLAAPTRG